MFLIPEVLRNIVTFGSVTPPIAGARQLVGTVDPRYLFINGLKNFTFNLPNIYLPGSSHWIAAIVYFAARLLRVPIDDAAIAEDGRKFELHNAGEYGHDTAINPIIVVVSVFCIFWMIYRWKQQKSSEKAYSIVSFSLFLFICIIIRWQPFVSRYMLPYLALLCPMAAIQIQDFLRNYKNEVRRISVVSVLIFMCIVEVISLTAFHGTIMKNNHNRPGGYYYYRGALNAEYSEITEIIKTRNFKNIGLILQEDNYEYPLWYILDETKVRIEHIEINNVSLKYEDVDFVPDCIISVTDFGNEFICGDTHYKKIVDIKEGEYISLYIRDTL